MATPAVFFVGVNTNGSRVHELFPRWMDALGYEARLKGVDLPLDASPEQYRSLVESISTDGDVLGAVITSHKLGVFAACSDLFAEIDPFAALTHEANCLHKTVRGLAAAACDPPAVRAVLNELVGNPEDVLCLGAGGAATAIAVSLLT